jgi:hypothetical protein
MKMSTENIATDRRDLESAIFSNNLTRGFGVVPVCCPKDRIEPVEVALDATLIFLKHSPGHICIRLGNISGRLGKREESA